MANIYYGDGGVSYVTGDWNDAGNWYLTLGNVCTCCGNTAGTPAGRVPSTALGDTVYLTCISSTGFGSPIVVTTGPSGGWSGSINGVGTFETYVNLSGVSASLFTGPINANDGRWTLASGTYNQTISYTGASPGAPPWRLTLPSGSTFNGALTGNFLIAGGTFTGNNSFRDYNKISGSPTFSGTTTFTAGYPLYDGGIVEGTPTFSNNVVVSAGTITINAGTFGTGTPINFTITGALATVLVKGGTYNKVTFAKTAAGTFTVTGGTWTPAATVSVNASNSLLVTTNLPKDPGFALSATYTPTITVSNVPGILGSGLP
jgi:hypothetical protein